MRAVDFFFDIHTASLCPFFLQKNTPHQICIRGTNVQNCHTYSTCHWNPSPGGGRIATICWPSFLMTASLPPSIRS